MPDQHEYPDDFIYTPPTGIPDLDTAWEIVNRLRPGILSQAERSYLVGAITGAIMKAREEEQQHVRGTTTR